jgi:hypothetical protein
MDLLAKTRTGRPACRRREASSAASPHLAASAYEQGPLLYLTESRPATHAADFSGLTPVGGVLVALPEAMTESLYRQITI